MKMKQQEMKSKCWEEVEQRYEGSVAVGTLRVGDRSLYSSH